MIPFSCNIKDIQERIDIFSQIITVQANLNEHALFNMVNIKELSLFEDFMEVFFNKQNKKVRKSFLHSHGFKYLDEYYNEGRRYDYLPCSRNILVINFLNSLMMNWKNMELMKSFLQ